MKILICGDRKYNSATRIANVLREITENYTEKNMVFIAGGASGADRAAEMILNNKGYHVARVNALWEYIKPKRSAGARRNRAMLLLSPDMVIAFHSKIEESKGTADMLTLAEKNGIEYFLVE